MFHNRSVVTTKIDVEIDFEPLSAIKKDKRTIMTHFISIQKAPGISPGGL